MAKLTLTAKLAAALEKIAALEETIRTQDDELEIVTNANLALNARLVVAAAVYKNQRARIAELEAELNKRGVKSAPVARPAYVPAAPTAETLAWRAYCAEQAEAAKAAGKCLKSMTRTEFSAWFQAQPEPADAEMA